VKGFEGIPELAIEVMPLVLRFTGGSLPTLFTTVDAQRRGLIMLSPNYNVKGETDWG